jgi:outer membrane protein assembly factor BamE
VYHSRSGIRLTTMRKSIPTLLLAMAAVSMLGACTAIYRPDVQQGNQWNYVATLQRRGGTTKERTLTLYFDNDTLVRTEGNFMKETPQELLRESHKYGPLYPSNLTKEEQKELEKKQKQGGGS